MNLRPVTAVQCSMLLLLAGYVLSSYGSLPAVVATHFNAVGAADGFIDRGSYIALFTSLVFAVPLAVGWLPGALARRGGAGLNIPNREYWMAPERRAQTAAYLQAHGLWFAVLLGAFLTFVHAQVVRANQVQPPVLSTSAVMAALGVFLLLVAVWLALLTIRFRMHA